MNMDIAALEALEAVVDHGSVGAASRALNKAASAVSYHLRRLEEQLGVTILDRGGYRLALTDDGRLVLNHARTILQKSRDLITLTTELRQGWEANLQLFFDGALPIEWILGALQELEAAGAPTRIELQVGFLDHVQAEFRRLNGNLLIACDVNRNPGLIAEPVMPIVHVLCCGTDHALAARTSPTLDELRDQTELVIQTPMSAHVRDRPFFGSRRVFRLSDFSAKLAAIRQGLGYGWLPLHLADAPLRSGEICEVRYAAGSRYTRQAAIVTHAGAAQGLALRSLIETLLRTAPAQPR